MSLSVDPTTNVALAILSPGYDQTQVAFDSTNAMKILGFVDDTHTPPNYTTPYALDNWYVCQTLYSSYQYQNLAWIVGNGSQKPQNPSCIKVDVKRHFV